MPEVLVSVHIEPLPEGGYLATSDELPGLVAQGRTIAETIDFARDVARALVETYEAHGDPLPPALVKFAAGGDVQFPVAVG